MTLLKNAILSKLIVMLLINSDLVGKFSNIFSRSASFIAKNNNKLAPVLDESYLEESRASEQKIYDLFESKNY